MTSSAATQSLLPASAEVPLAEQPDLPLWSENYCFQAYDAALDIGFWTHIGLPVFDFGLWHDISLVYLPGGDELLCAKGFGRRREAEDVSGSMASANYDERTGEWLVRFHGAAQRMDRHYLEREAVRDARVQPYACELRFRGISPVWDLQEAVANQTWSNAHWEQPCRVEGWIALDGVRRRFDGYGVRDHSRGTRDFAGMGTYYWLHGQFPSGRAFGLLHVEPASSGGHPMSRAYVVDAGRLHEANVVSLPPDRTFTEPFEVLIEGPRGLEHIRGTEIHQMTFSLQYPNDVLLGYRAGEAQHLVREGQIKWTWDTECGYGVGERGVRVTAAGAVETL